MGFTISKDVRDRTRRKRQSVLDETESVTEDQHRGHSQSVRRLFDPIRGTTVTRGLPSINLRFKPSDSVQIRLAYGVTMDQAQFNDLRATGNIGANRTNDVFNGTFNADTGNPLLNPAISKNSDLSVEWYHGSTTAHVSLFHKEIKDALVYSSGVKDVELFLNDGSTTTIQANRNEVNNSTALSMIKGIELGGRIFFDRLPAPWNGFGVEANYTYVDSKSPGELYYDIDGGAHDDAPMRGLSENNYNLQLMFEKPKFGARLAWSWRSEYLLGTNVNGTNGDYWYFPTPNLGAANTIVPTFRGYRAADVRGRSTVNWTSVLRIARRRTCRCPSTSGTCWTRSARPSPRVI